jgi:GNAT superfamily N-acetyltransferase
MLGSSETLSAFFPGVDEAWDGAIRFFSHHGYRRMRPTVFVNIDLVHFSPPERVLEKIAELRESGIRMDLSSSDHESAYEAFMREQGHAGWEDRLEHWRSAPENTVVAIEGDRIVGEVPSLWAKEGRAGYGNIYTVSDYRGRGIGMGMLVKVMGVCRDRGAVTMPLWTRPETHERFYAKLGYFIERSYVVWGKALNVEILSPGWITRYH